VNIVNNAALVFSSESIDSCDRIFEEEPRSWFHREQPNSAAVFTYMGGVNRGAVFTVHKKDRHIIPGTFLSIGEHSDSFHVKTTYCRSLHKSFRKK
jgi:hypothetical protein